MTTHVDEATSEVVVEKDSAQGPVAHPQTPGWQMLEEARRAAARIARDRARTAAWGFDD